MGGENNIEYLSSLLKEAEDIASRYGEVIGFVSRVERASVGEDERLIRIDIPFERYLLRPLKTGFYIGIASPIARVLILGRVIRIERQDLLKIAGIPSLGELRDPRGIVTPLSVVVELISERRYDGGEVMPALSPVDPQSPVFRPRGDFIEEMLGLPREGVSIGGIVEASERRDDVVIRLSEKILRHHVLVVGTTGSGKTTLLTRIFIARGVKGIALDTQGDYVKRSIKAGLKPYVIVPLSIDFLGHMCGHRGYCLEDRLLTEMLPEVYARLRGLPSPIVIGANKLGGIEVSFGKHEAILIPYALRLSDIYNELGKILPILSQQASIFVPTILRNCIGMGEAQSENDLLKCVDNKMQNFYLHESTKNNIRRSLKMLLETGIVDVRIKNKTISEPDYGEMLSTAEKVVVDLKVAMDYSSRIAPTIIGYRILSKVFEHRDTIYKRGEKLDIMLLIIDEAHEFFPQGGKEGFERESLEDMINRIMRLGRVRGLGCIMATHRPQDLNDLVIELANTKIALRSDEDTLRKIGMERHAKRLETAPEGMGVIKTHGYRSPEIIFRTIPPDLQD